MTSNELKRMSRAQLLQMLMDQIKQNQQLKKQVLQLQTILKKRTIVVREAGSIAEAALRLNGVFEAAQAAAQQYLDSVQEAAQRTAQVKQPSGADSDAARETAYTEKNMNDADFDRSFEEMMGRAKSSTLEGHS